MRRACISWKTPSRSAAAGRCWTPIPARRFWSSCCSRYWPSASSRLPSPHAELFFDEAQYWAWGQEPAFGYYTKPPLIAWIIGATTSLCGDTPFCVRLPSPLMHFADLAGHLCDRPQTPFAPRRLLGGAGLCADAGHVDLGDADVDRRAAAAVLGDRHAGDRPPCRAAVAGRGRRCSASRSALASTPNTR